MINLKKLKLKVMTGIKEPVHLEIGVTKIETYLRLFAVRGMIKEITVTNQILEKLISI